MSLSQERNLELAVFGYIRKLEKLRSFHQRFIPNVVKELIISYARNCFSWYTEKHGKGYRFFEDNAFQAEKTKGCYSFLTSANILSLDICKKFEWEVTIIEKNVSDKVAICFMIGFVTDPMESSINDWNTYFTIKENQFGVEAYSIYSCLSKYGRDGNQKKFAEENGLYKIKDGDRFCYRFDFEQSKCSFGYNDKFTEDFYINIPARIIPVVCIYDPMIFSCTKWNAIF